MIETLDPSLILRVADLVSKVRRPQLPIQEIVERLTPPPILTDETDRLMEKQVAERRETE